MASYHVFISAKGGDLSDENSWKSTTQKGDTLYRCTYENVKGVITARASFSDTSDVNVEKAAAISVVSGVGNNRFDPDASLTAFRDKESTDLSCADKYRKNKLS